METDENEDVTKNAEIREAKEKKKEKDKAQARMFDTQFMESVRLRHQNISLDDNNNQSFKFSSEADNDRPSIPNGLDNGQLNTIVNQSLLSINQYSSNAMNLKKNQKGDAGVGDATNKIPNRYSTRNIENLITEFIKRDSIMISDGNELNTSR